MHARGQHQHEGAAWTPGASRAPSVLFVRRRLEVHRVQDTGAVGEDEHRAEGDQHREHGPTGVQSPERHVPLAGEARERRDAAHGEQAHRERARGERHCERPAPRSS
jgi:hypothetical protein